MSSTSSQSARVRKTVKRAERRYESRWIDGGKPRAAKGSRDASGRFSPFTTKTAATAFAAEQVEILSRETEQQTQPGKPELPPTIDALLDRFEAGYALGIGTKKKRQPDKGTVKAVKVRLLHARRKFGDRAPDSLTMDEIETWMVGIPDGMRHDSFRAFRQALRWGLKRNLMTTDPSADIENPAPTKDERRRIIPFADWSEVEAVAAEMDARWAAIPAVLVGTGLRPGELFGLFRSDVTYDHERRCGSLTVQRRYTKGELKEGLKTGKRSRRVPFGRRVYDALRSMPVRLDSEFLFVAARGGPVNQEQFAARMWTPAVKAAGLDHRPMYDARHTAITWWLLARVPIDTVADWAGTSIKMIDQHYRESMPQHDEFAFAIDDFGQAVGE